MQLEAGRVVEAEERAAPPKHSWPMYSTPHTAYPAALQSARQLEMVLAGLLRE